MIKASATFLAKGSGILVYMMSNRAKFLEQNPEANENDIIQALKAEWDAMNDSQRYIWTQQEFENPTILKRDPRLPPSAPSSQKCRELVPKVVRRSGATGYVYFYKKRLTDIKSGNKDISVSQSSRMICNEWFALTAVERKKLLIQEIESRKKPKRKRSKRFRGIYTHPGFTEFRDDLIYQCFLDSKPIPKLKTVRKRWTGFSHTEKELWAKKRPVKDPKAIQQPYGKPSWGPAKWSHIFQEDEWNLCYGKGDTSDFKSKVIKKQDIILKGAQKVYEMRAILHNLVEQETRVEDCCKILNIGIDHPERAAFVQFLQELFLRENFMCKSYKIARLVIIESYKTIPQETKKCMQEIATTNLQLKRYSRCPMNEKDTKIAFVYHLQKEYYKLRLQGNEPMLACNKAAVHFMSMKDREKLLIDAFKNAKYARECYTRIAQSIWLSDTSEVKRKWATFVRWRKFSTKSGTLQQIMKETTGHAPISIYKYFLKQNISKKILAFNCTCSEAMAMCVKEFKALTADEKAKLEQMAKEFVQKPTAIVHRGKSAYSIFMKERFQQKRKEMPHLRSQEIMPIIVKEFQALSAEQKEAIVSRALQRIESAEGMSSADCAENLARYFRERESKRRAKKQTSKKKSDVRSSEKLEKAE